MELSRGGGGRHVTRLDPTQNDVVDIGRDDVIAKLAVASDGNFSFPQVHIQQSTPDDFARIRLVSTQKPPPAVDNPSSGPAVLSPFWDIAVGGGASDALNIFHQTRGNILTLNGSRGGFVGIGTTDRVAELDVRGVARMSILDITGGADISEAFAIEEGAEPDVAINPPGSVCRGPSVPCRGVLGGPA